MSDLKIVLRNLWKHAYAMGSVDTALTALHAIRDAEERDIADLVESLWTTFFVSYARPFTSNREVGGISPKLVPAKHRDTHEICLAARNALFGHYDPTLKSSQETGVLEVSVEISRRGFVPITRTPMPAPDEWQRYHDLAEAVLHQLTHQVGFDLDRVPGLHSFPDGRYLVEITDPAGARFKRMPDDPDEGITVIDF